MPGSAIDADEIKLATDEITLSRPTSVSAGSKSAPVIALLLFFTKTVLVMPFNHNRHATALAGMVVWKKRMPSAPTATSSLPLAPLVATTPRSVTKGLAGNQIPPGRARHGRDNTSLPPELNALLGTTKPSEPARSDL